MSSQISLHLDDRAKGSVDVGHDFRCNIVTEHRSPASTPGGCLRNTHLSARPRVLQYPTTPATAMPHREELGALRTGRGPGCARARGLAGPMRAAARIGSQWVLICT